MMTYVMNTVNVTADRFIKQNPTNKQTKKKTINVSSHIDPCFTYL